METQTIKQGPIGVRWKRGQCALCLEICEPDAYLHRECAAAWFDIQKGKAEKSAQELRANYELKKSKEKLK